MNPYSQSSGYMGLLHSQQKSVLHENSPYESFHSRSSEIPQFSSQQCEAQTPPTDIPVERGKRHKWIPADDELLISPWEHLHYKQRWHKINDQTNKFCGAYAAAKRQISSGQNDNDVLKVAHDIFYSDQESKFTLEHAWCVLRHEQKWLSLNTTKACGSSKRKSGSQLSSTSVTDHEIRPEGVKAAKAKRSNGQGKSVADYTSV
ncbi:glutathione S-transferase T2-like [Brassica napus]|uniref:glutathione S-transferase T2-like n=1 Tax=Brassica napus TaxID=3708 RepID=UPI00207922B0|nr:glutathione S-transferase T2-like [Brassica napus]